MQDERMDFKYIKEETIKRAVQKGICEDWALFMKNAKSIDELLDMYIKGIDFSFYTGFVSNDFIRKYYKGKMEHKGIFLDEKLNLENKRNIICIGQSNLNYLGDNSLFDKSYKGITEIRLKDQTKAKIIVKDKAFVMVDIFDKVELEVETHNDARVCVNVYIGAKVNFKKLDNSLVKINYKKTKTYS